MTLTQAVEAASRSGRKAPLIWALVIAQISLHLFLVQLVYKIPSGMMPPAWLGVGGLLSIIALGCTGVGGLAWTDDAVSALRAFRGLPEPPMVAAEPTSITVRPSRPPT